LERCHHDSITFVFMWAHGPDRLEQ
jgi:hypothetical protein